MKILNNETKKKKRVSKRNKIAWRKHIDITDVENYLDDQRLEQILGPVSEKPDEELFQIDTTPNKVTLTTRQRRKLKILEPAKCYSALNAQSKIPDPVGKRSTRKSKEQRQEKIIISDVIKAKKRQKMVVKLINSERVSKIPEEDSSEVKYDLWNADLSLVGNNNIDIDVRNDSWICGDAERHLMHGEGKRSKIVPKTVGKKPLGVNSIELPHPGMSYNPSFKDHQDLLQKIAEKEKEIIKEEQHITRVTRQMFRKIPPDEKYQDWVKEMSQGLPNLDTTLELQETEKIDNTPLSLNPPVVNKKKTLKQRRKQKAEQRKELNKKLEKLEKRKVTSIHRLKFLETHMKKLDEKSKIKQSKKSKKLEAGKTSVKRLGRTKFEEPDLEFNLAQDIAGNLRNIKKEGNLLADRWNSLQKRNLIEVTKIRNTKKAKVKKFTKVGHKEDWKESIAKPNKSWDTTRKIIPNNKNRSKKVNKADRKSVV